MTRCWCIVREIGVGSWLFCCRCCCRCRRCCCCRCCCCCGFCCCSLLLWEMHGNLNIAKFLVVFIEFFIIIVVIIFIIFFIIIVIFVIIFKVVIVILIIIVIRIKFGFLAFLDLLQFQLFWPRRCQWFLIQAFFFSA